ncbi:sensor histidine kinase [Bacteroides timonensis]|uniref:sensor histidine kinase n=1 Tax=Bacteroides timonensis TaxID=1470345 RepID=UPI0004B143FF|nr:HAMP domain-containing sensor histidine kinase [Bacteroides timonensis]
MPTKTFTPHCLLLCLMLLAAGAGMPLSAQNNPYKIADSLYPLYQRATRLRSLPESLATADTLYHRATKLGDKKAQCLARIIPLQYYTDRKDEPNILKALEELKKISRANGYLQYYYYGWNNYIVYLLNNNHSLTALKEAEEMKLQAFDDHHDYGIYTCINTMANIYQSRGNSKMAVGYQLELLKFMQERLPDQDPTQVYLKIVAHYRGERDFKLAEEYVRKAEKSVKTEQMQARILLEKCMLRFMQGQFDEFSRCYEEATRALKGNKSAEPNFPYVMVYKKLIDKDYKQAYALADSLAGSIVTKLSLYIMIAEAEGNYKLANDARKATAYHMQERANQLQSSDLAELNAQIGNERLKLENVRLDLKNTGLLLDKRALEVSQLKTQAQLQRAETEKQHAEAERQRAETEKLRAEAEKQKTRLDQQRTASRYQMALFGIAVAFMAFLHLRRRHNLRRLQKKNEELAVARDQAQSANRMKSLFIQNMSHEIRTPLNSIVGFSQLIANPDMELEPEEAQEYSQLIETNSELLTTLVNDLLGLAELESGKYVTKMAHHSCNELCRESIATVTHRKPQDVKLYYTSDASDDYQLTTDGQRVRQVLINFLTNAEKHTGQGEIHLHCSLTETPGHVTFSVTDTGTGIPPEQAEHIFERFEKLDDFTQGFGLGLNICRLIAEYLNGTVKLDTGYRKGARFLFILPASSS